MLEGISECLRVHSKSQELYSIFRLLCAAAEIKVAVNLAAMFCFGFFFLPMSD